MAALTTLAIIGLAGAAAAMSSKKIAAKKAADQKAKDDAAAAAAKAGAALNAPGPSDVTAQPPDANQARSDAQSLALTAATKAKRKAKGTGTQVPLGGAPAAKAQLTTKTLLGF